MQIKREDLLEDWRDWLMKHSGPNYPEAKIEFLNLKHTRGEKINEPLSPDDLMQIKSPADYRKFEGLYTPQGQMLHDFLKRWKRPGIIFFFPFIHDSSFFTNFFFKSSKKSKKSKKRKRRKKNENTFALLERVY